MFNLFSPSLTLTDIRTIRSKWVLAVLKASLIVVMTIVKKCISNVEDVDSPFVIPQAKHRESIL